MTTRRHLLFLAATLSLTIIVTPANAQRQTNSDEQEVTNFRLTADNLNKFVASTTALMKLTHDDPKLRQQVADEQNGKTIAQSVAAMNKFPNVVSAIRGGGISVHDYVVMTATLVTSSMVVGMKKQGTIKDIPPMVSTENASFVDQNFDKITTLLKKMQEDSK